MRRSLHLRIVAVGVLVIVIGGALTRGQYQVNRQIYGSAGPSASVRYQPAWSSAMPSVPKTSMALPSETRNYMAKSGMLPSDLRVNYGRLGPLAPNGTISYAQPTSSYRPNSAGPSGNRVNTMAGSSGAKAPTAGTSPFASGNLGSVRYGSAAPMPGSLAFAPASSPGGGINAALSPTAAVNASVSPTLGFGKSSSYSSGSIRYSNP